MTKGLRDAVKLLKLEWKIYKKHQEGIKKASKYPLDDQPMKLHLGCGLDLKKGWVNIDILGAVDLNVDLREPIPLPDNSCSVIYSEHLLEHFDYPEGVKHLLSECLRMLQPGAIFSAGVPDTEWPLLAYGGSENHLDYFKHARERWHPHCKTRLQHLNIHFREYGEHKYAYDFETLQVILEEAGFIDVVRRAFDPTLDTTKRELGTIYLQCKKPSHST